MDIAQFQLRSLTYELRYEPAFKLWDSSGFIWDAIQEKWPDLKTVEAAPNAVKMHVMSKAEMAVYLERLHVIWPGRKIDVEEFISFCKVLTDVAASRLSLTQLKRVGVRQIYMKRYKNQEDAIRDFFAAGALKLPDGKNFGVQGKPKPPECTLRAEDDALGWMAHFFVQNRKITFEPALGEDEIPKIDEERHDLTFDFDYYTTATMNLEQLRPDEWIKQAIRLCHRDAKVILGG